MPKANADQVRLSYAEETTFGVAITGTNYQLLRFTSESLANASQSSRSAEIDPGRQVTEFFQLDLNTAGSIEGELSFSTYDDFIEAALYADGSGWDTQTATLTAGSATITAATGTIAATGVATGVAVGEWLLLSGATNAANNVLVKVLTRADADSITVASFAPLVDESPTGLTVTRLSQIANGTKQRFFTIERQYTDLTNEHVRYVGNVIEAWSVTVETRRIVTTTFGVRGKTESTETSSAGDGYDAATTTTPFNSVANVAGTMLGAPAVNTNYNQVLTRFTFNLTNNLRDQPGLSQLGPDGYGSGKFEGSGAIALYYEESGEIDSFINFTTSAAAIAFTDGAGNYLVVEFPSVKFSSGNRNTPGENQDILAQLEFQAFKDESEGISCRVSRFTAA